MEKNLLNTIVEEQLPEGRMMSASQFGEDVSNIETPISLILNKVISNILNAIKDSDDSAYYTNEDGYTCFDIVLSGYKKRYYIASSKALYPHRDDSAMIPIYTDIFELLSILRKKGIDYVYIIDGDSSREKHIGEVSNGIIAMTYIKGNEILSTELNMVKNEIAIYDIRNEKILDKSAIELLDTINQ